MAEVPGIDSELIPDLSDLTENGIYNGPMITATNRMCLETAKLTNLMIEHNINEDILTSYSEVITCINTVLYLTVLMHSKRISRMN